MSNNFNIKAVKKKNYSQIAYDSLANYINERMQHASDDDDLKLPAETSLAEMMAISRITLRQVLTELETEGKVLRVHGRGTFINKNYRHSTPFLDCSELIRHQGYEPTYKVIKAEKLSPSERIAERLECSTETSLWQIDTIYYADNNPCIVLRDWIIPGKNLEHIDVGEIGLSYYDFLNNLTGKNGAREQSILYAAGGTVMMDMFGEQYFSADAVMVQDAVLYDHSNTPICVTEGFYNPNYIQFHFFGKINVE